MLTPHEETASPKVPQLLIARIIWTAILASHFLLGFVIYMIKVPQLPEELVAGLDFSPAGILQAFLNQMQNPLSLMLTGVAAVAAMAAFVVPAILLKVQQAKDQKLAADSPSGQRFERNFSSFVVRLALLEAVSIIGFYQVFVLAGNPVLFIPFLLVGVGLHLTQFPKDIHLGFEESAF